MIISVDTDKMNAMAALAQRVCSEIDMCISNLMPVVEHNDWNCKERDVINEDILSVKNNAKVLQENVNSFSSVIKQVANLFDDFEASIPNKYQIIDSFLGTTFAIPCAETSVTIGTATTSVATAMAEKVHISGGLENNVLGNLANPIQMCNFEDLDFAKCD